MTAALCALVAPLAGSGGGSGGSGGQMTATAVPDYLERTRGGKSGSLLVTTAEPAVASVSGGVAPFTYAWAQVSGDTISITSPAAASTYFSANIPVDDSRTAVFVCTVTDALGAHSAANEVQVSLSAIAFSGGTLF